MEKTELQAWAEGFAKQLNEYNSSPSAVMVSHYQMRKCIEAAEYSRKLFLLANKEEKSK